MRPQTSRVAATTYDLFEQSVLKRLNSFFLVVLELVHYVD